MGGIPKHITYFYLYVCVPGSNWTGIGIYIYFFFLFFHQSSQFTSPATADGYRFGSLMIHVYISKWLWREWWRYTDDLRCTSQIQYKRTIRDIKIFCSIFWRIYKEFKENFVPGWMTILSCVGWYAWLILWVLDLTGFIRRLYYNYAWLQEFTNLALSL
jgi:hypothetical protein